MDLRERAGLPGILGCAKPLLYQLGIVQILTVFLTEQLDPML